MEREPYKKQKANTDNGGQLPKSKTQAYFSAQNAGVATKNGRSNGVSLTETSPNSTMQQGNALEQIMANQYKEVQKFNEQVSELKAEIQKTKDFYKAVTKLSKISYTAIILLLAVPILQLIACTVVTYYLGIQEQLSPIINWILGSLSVASLIEIIMFFVKMYDWEKRLKKLETEKEISRE